MNKTIFSTLLVALSLLGLTFSQSASAKNIVTLLGGNPIEVENEGKKERIEGIDELSINNFVDKDGRLTSETVSQSSDRRYTLVELVPGSATFIAQTPESNDSVGLSIESIRSCLRDRPQLYTLARVQDAATGKVKTLGIAVKFNGEHGTIRLNAKGKPVCSA